MFADDFDRIREESTRDDYLIDDVYSLETMLSDARHLIREIKEKYHTRKLNSVDRKLSEVEDDIEELLEKGIG